jgi:hypothetical protein
VAQKIFKENVGYIFKIKHHADKNCVQPRKGQN